MTTYLFDQLAQTPHILTFAGQSTPWVQALKETQNDAELNKELREYNKLAKTLLLSLIHI